MTQYWAKSVKRSGVAALLDKMPILSGFVQGAIDRNIDRGHETYLEWVEENAKASIKRLEAKGEGGDPRAALLESARAAIRVLTGSGTATTLELANAFLLLGNAEVYQSMALRDKHWQ
jgi:hypothetical protein